MGSSKNGCSAFEMKCRYDSPVTWEPAKEPGSILSKVMVSMIGFSSPAAMSAITAVTHIFRCRSVLSIHRAYGNYVTGFIVVDALADRYNSAAILMSHDYGCVKAGHPALVLRGTDIGMAKPTSQRF